MALGRPIVATAVGGVPDVIANGETGLLVSPRSPSELAAAIERLFTDSALAARLAKRARLVAKAEHGLGRMIQRIESLYDEVLAHG
jgi:glycosyltransferase involved in cell wall biosynthesis